MSPMKDGWRIWAATFVRDYRKCQNEIQREIRDQRNRDKNLSSLKEREGQVSSEGKDSLADGAASNSAGSVLGQSGNFSLLGPVTIIRMR